MANTFQGKVVLITGAASGIGRVTAQAFAREGANVVLSDVTDDLGQRAAQELVDSGGKATFIHADVTKGAEVRALTDKIDQVHGRLDVAINNAGIDGIRARTAEYPEDIWEQVLAVNLTGVFLCMKYEIPLLLKGPSGVIINISSVAGVTGFVGHAGYAASKHGVVGLTRTAAIEYAKSGLRVNAICPCYTRTPMVERLVEAKPQMGAKLQSRIPLGRMGTPEEIAAASLYLSSASAAFITGHTLMMDGGIMAE